MPGLYDARALEAVTRSFTLRSSVRATSPDWEDDVPLDVTRWSISVDEERIPHVRAEVVIATPDETTLALLDPRYQVYIEVDSGYVYDDETVDLQPYMNLGLRRRVVTHTETTLTIESEESFVDDANLPFDTGDATTSTGTYVEDLIEEVLTTYTDVAITPTINVGIAAATTLPSPHSMTYTPAQVTDAVEQAKQWASAVDAVLWCDQMGVWQLLPTPDLTGSSVATIATGSNVTGYRRTLSRDDGWANRVGATYADNSAAWQLTPGSPTAPTDPTTYRDRLYDHEFSFVPASATVNGTTGEVTPTDPAVSEILNRVRSRGERIEISTVMHLWIRAADKITAVLGEYTDTFIVSAFDGSSDGDMTITTRKPE